MAAQTYELKLSGFDFPAALPNDKANFRFIADIRYIKADGSFATEQVVIPGLDAFWECATDKSAEPNFVRSNTSASFDMGRIDDWDSLMLVFNASSVHSIKVTVFDVNREDAWDKVKSQLGPILDAVLTKATALVPAAGPAAALRGNLGGAADAARSYLLKRLAGGDQVLFAGSAALTTPLPPASLTRSISGSGTAGTYKVDLTLSVVATGAGGAAAEGTV